MNVSPAVGETRRKVLMGHPLGMDGSVVVAAAADNMASREP
jgi:hypothetical protein